MAESRVSSVSISIMLMISRVGALLEEDCLQVTASPLGPNKYSRVLDYSIFKSLLVPYSENFTTRPSSRVVAIFTFLVRIIQISKKTEKGHFFDDLMYHSQQCLYPFIMEFMN